MSLRPVLTSWTSIRGGSAPSDKDIVKNRSEMSRGNAVNDGNFICDVSSDSDGDVEMCGGLYTKDRLIDGTDEENVYKQPLPFSKTDVVSYIEDGGSQDHQISQPKADVHISSNEDPGASSENGKEIDSPRATSAPEASKFVTIEEAHLSIIERFNTSEKHNSEWESYLESRIAALGEDLLDRKGTTVSLNKKNLKIQFKLKEDPEERMEALFQENEVQDFKKREFDHIAHIFKSRLLKELENPDSSYSKLMSFKKELCLRQLRLEIINKIHHELWYFVLQHIPPIELKPKTTHCAQPYCLYHTLDFMPAGAYRLVFMNANQNCQQQHRFEEINDQADSPGRTRYGQIVFCLECVEDLFNGAQFIKKTDGITGGNALERVGAGESPSDSKGDYYPDPPQIGPRLMAPGLDIFTVELHTFIKPELRYTWHEFYTLNSFEYHAFMKWKNMCIRKTMWEIPSNRAFNLQIPGAEDDYDFVDFFGDDILDIDGLQPSIVAGVALKMEKVSVDDISTVEYQEPPRQAIFKNDRDTRTGYSQSMTHITNGDGSNSSEHGLLVEGNAKAPNCNKTRVLHPLSAIMSIVDHRVQKTWSTMEPPYVPSLSKKTADPPYRKWPALSFWPDQFEKWGALQKASKRKHEVMGVPIGESSLSGLKDGVGETGADVSPVVTPRHRLNKKGRPGFCVTCGSVASPEWRNGPQGSNTLCNACGIRYTRGRGRRLVPPPI